MKSTTTRGTRCRLLLASIGAIVALASPSRAGAASFNILHSFQVSVDGQQPYSSLAVGSDGRLYGTTPYGGTSGNGILFAIAANGTGFTVLRNLDYTADGANPYGGLVQGSDGRLYGTTSAGGTFDAGTLFAVGTDGTGFTVLRHLNYGADGAYPNAGLIQGSDGRLYGTATGGGAFGTGTLYAIGTDGSGFTVLRHMSNSPDGAYPSAVLVQGSDGRLYGTAFAGGTNESGTVFALATDGTGFTVLHHMFAPTDGGNPYAGLVQGSDGRLYGTAIYGGTNDTGTIFAVAAGGTGFVVLHNMNLVPDGGYLYSGLVQGSDGRLYGTAAFGGTFGGGTLYAIRNDGTGYSVLHNLNFPTEGGHPYGGLVLGSGGLYGTAADFGLNGDGTLFSLALAPAISSPLVASGTFNQAFNYAITATNSPTDFDALNLPSNLSVNFTTGVISGAPAQTGSFTVNIAAANSAGIGVADLALTIGKATAGVSITNTSQAFDGSAKSVTVTTSPGGLGTTVTYNGSTTPPSGVGSYPVVATVNDANYQGTASATLQITSTASGPLQIVTQPQGIDVVLGQTATFKVVATASTPISYQWRKNGSNIPGATGSTLTLNNVQVDDAASYRVLVSTTGAPSILSSVAILAVIVPPTITNEPDDLTKSLGDNATFAVTAIGTRPFTYQWRKNGIPIEGETSRRLQLTNVDGSDTATYSVVVTNAAGHDTSRGAKLTVLLPPTIVDQPDNVTGIEGQTVTFSVTATGTKTLTYQWRKNGNRIHGETSNKLRLTNIDPSDAGTYSVVVSNDGGSTTSLGALLVVIVPPTITNEPDAVTTKAGDDVVFTVSAKGTKPLSYQWRKNGVAIPGANTNRLELHDVDGQDAATYSVVVTNEGGSDTSHGAKLTVLLPPTIVTQPASVTQKAGKNVTFTVTATGSTALSYQWRKNGERLRGETSNKLQLDKIKASDAGVYSVVVTNEGGSTTSLGATLTVQ